MIHCAIAGLGRWGRALVEAAKANPRLKIVRAVEADLDSARNFCGERGIALTGEFEAMLSEITEPTKASVIATFSEAKKYGIERGRPILMRIWCRLAPSARITSSE